ncbi:hypothetical protein KC19_1G007700 [Ceratodon purpureus]|uniref:DUF4470 domain-containing protein n=1 Tax=Ceratodon purpureus TaxID=3225 RepID=A0A8T0IZV4_CERPU|nr:hypothetical protein KC19_1G007700 [Ceratodon purpureus]
MSIIRLLLDDMDANVSIVNSKLVDNDPAACYVKGGTTVLLDKCEIEVDKDRTGLSVGINYDATVTSTGNKFVVVDRKSAMVEEVSAGGGAGFCRRIINRDNLVVVQQASRSRAPTKLKGVSALKQMKHAFRVDRSEARARSLQQMTQTSRRVLHAARNLGVFCGVRDSTFGTDLSLGQDLSTIPVDKDAPRTIRILMGACGDIRNLLKTVFSLKQYPDLLVQVVCNDWNLAILARTIVLFSLIEQGTSADDVLAIWANDALTSSQREQLDKILILLASSLPEWVVCLRERSSHLGAELLGIFASWRDWELTLEDLDNLHAESISDEWKHMVVDFGSGSVGNIHADNHNNQQVFTFNGKRSKAMKSANILFLEAPSLKYTLHWASSICSAINLEESDSTGSSSSRSSASRLESTGPEGLYELLMRTISIDEINALAVMFKQGALHVGVMNSNILDGMLHGDCLELLHKLNRQPQHPTRTPPPLFDFIDLSDSADYLSMPAVVQAGLTLLKVEKHASLHINSFTWGMSFDTRQPLEFLKCSIGMELDTYKELLGVSVQTQVVGSSRLPILQTQWTWDLHGNQEATLTGAMVLLELMMAVKLHCAIDRIKYISNEGVRLNSDGMVAGFMGGIEYSSPLTLLHLIHQRFPDIALQIISVLICANDTFECRKWELIHHFMSQHEPKMTPYTFFPAYFQGNVQYTTLLACPEAPLCLMVSGALVRVTRSSPVEVHAANVLYLLEAFSYSIESDRVEVLLPLEYLNQYRHYFVTLCAVTNATKLQALGSSVPWTEIKVRMDQAPFTAWTPCKRLAQRALLPDGLFSDGIELEEFMGKILAKGNATGQSWKTHAVLETRTHVIVQLLTPGPLPLPGSDNVTITVTMVGSSLKVVAANASNRQKRGSMTFRDQEHTVQLPAAVSFAERRLKLSRKLGIMIVHLPKVAVVSA